MPRDGCRECSRRRIKCDKSVPECKKCQKKGIQCTGIGRHIRFVNGLIKKEKPGRQKIADESLAEKLSKHLDGQLDQSASASQTEGAEDDLGNNDTDVIAASGRYSRRLTAQDDLFREGTALVVHRSSNRNSVESSDAFFNNSYQEIWQRDPSIDLTLEIIKPGIQMLFDHFSRNIASIMVVSDHGPNGYRDILLPLAVHDDLVQRAVSVVAAFHLSARQPDLLPAAESGRCAIINKLRNDAFDDQNDRVFNISTWATILLLLVGETVTGSQGFVHLYPMLTSLLNNNKLLMAKQSTMSQFLLQQTRMFQLFTPPLLDPSQGCEAFQKDLDFYFDFFVSVQSPNNPQLATNVIIYQEAIKQARNLYMKQTLQVQTPEQLWSDIEALKILVTPIMSNSPGMHTLPWVYFIAAASSQDLGQREFFTKRLMQVYQKTRMKNILVALIRLEEIWRLHPDSNWARNPRAVNPVLII